MVRVRVDVGARPPGFKSQLYHVLDLQTFPHLHSGAAQHRTWVNTYKILKGVPDA